jgi:hypothetical protein
VGLISSGISKVRTFCLPAGIGADGRITKEPRRALIRWHSEWPDKLYQVYINGEYAGSTFGSKQRELIVHIPSSPQSAVRIEVFAVEPELVDLDFSDELEGDFEKTGRVKISWPRSQSLPFGAATQIYSNHGEGDVDYESPVNNAAKRVWPAWQDKCGFGLSRFGRSDFGFDASAAIGFGKGFFGLGEFGLDADVIDWTSEQMQAGAYKFAVKVVDSQGNQDEGQGETELMTVIPAAKPAEDMSLTSFDKQTNKLVFSIS